MADFYQTGIIATLHRLGQGNLQVIERQLEYFSRQQPIALVLPALYSEFEKPAMDSILSELRGATYLRQIVLTLAQATAEQFEEVQKRVSVLPGEVRVLWHDGPRMQRLYKTLEDNRLQIGPIPGSVQSHERLICVGTLVNGQQVCCRSHATGPEINGF